MYSTRFFSITPEEQSRFSEVIRQRDKLHRRGEKPAQAEPNLGCVLLDMLDRQCKILPIQRSRKSSGIAVNTTIVCDWKKICYIGNCLRVADKKLQGNTTRIGAIRLARSKKGAK